MNKIGKEMSDAFDGIISKSFDVTHETDSRLVWPKEMILAKYDALKQSHEKLVEALKGKHTTECFNKKLEGRENWSCSCGTEQALTEAEEIK